MYIDQLCDFVKLRLHQCFPNAHNLFSQVGLIAINVLGVPAEVGEPAARVDSAAPLRALPPGPAPPVADLAVDINFDTDTARKLRALYVAKTRAVELEDYEQVRWRGQARHGLRTGGAPHISATALPASRAVSRLHTLDRRPLTTAARLLPSQAKRLKTAEGELTATGARIASLEAQKRAAVEAEHFERAASLKAEVAGLRSQLDATLRSCPLFTEALAAVAMADGPRDLPGNSRRSARSAAEAEAEFGALPPSAGFPRSSARATTPQDAVPQGGDRGAPQYPAPPVSASHRRAAGREPAFRDAASAAPPAAPAVGALHEDRPLPALQRRGEGGEEAGEEAGVPSRFRDDPVPARPAVPRRHPPAPPAAYAGACSRCAVRALSVCAHTPRTQRARTMMSRMDLRGAVAVQAAALALRRARWRAWRARRRCRIRSRCRSRAWMPRPPGWLRWGKTLCAACLAG